MSAIIRIRTNLGILRVKLPSLECSVLVFKQSFFQQHKVPVDQQVIAIDEVILKDSDLFSQLGVNRDTILVLLGKIVRSVVEKTLIYDDGSMVAAGTTVTTVEPLDIEGDAPVLPVPNPIVPAIPVAAVPTPVPFPPALLSPESRPLAPAPVQPALPALDDFYVDQETVRPIIPVRKMRLMDYTPPAVPDSPVTPSIEESMLAMMREAGMSEAEIRAAARSVPRRPSQPPRPNARESSMTEEDIRAYERQFAALYSERDAPSAAAAAPSRPPILLSPRVGLSSRGPPSGFRRESSEDRAEAEAEAEAVAVRAVAREGSMTEDEIRDYERQFAALSVDHNLDGVPAAAFSSSSSSSAAAVAIERPTTRPSFRGQPTPQSPGSPQMNEDVLAMIKQSGISKAEIQEARRLELMRENAVPKKSLKLKDRPVRGVSSSAVSSVAVNLTHAPAPAPAPLARAALSHSAIDRPMTRVERSLALGRDSVSAEPKRSTGSSVTPRVISPGELTPTSKSFKRQKQMAPEARVQTREPVVVDLTGSSLPVKKSLAKAAAKPRSPQLDLTAAASVTRSSSSVSTRASTITHSPPTMTVPKYSGATASSRSRPESASTHTAPAASSSTTHTPSKISRTSSGTAAATAASGGKKMKFTPPPYPPPDRIKQAAAPGSTSRKDIRKEEVVARPRISPVPDLAAPSSPQPTGPAALEAYNGDMDEDLAIALSMSASLSHLKYDPDIL